MYIENLKGSSESSGEILLSDSKRALVGAGARALFYPTLVYNVVRNKLQAEFRWWDQIEEFLLLGAVPFPTDVQRLKDLGVRGVVTLNEPYETLVPTSLYRAHGIDHLVLPTRDYLFAPSIDDICEAVNFIHGKTLLKQATYVHCKAGRGRSTTIVICYLIQHRHMSPDDAYAYRQNKHVRFMQFSSNIGSGGSSSQSCSTICKFFPYAAAAANVFTFDDGSVVVITKADLVGYDDDDESRSGGQISSGMNMVCRIPVAALARFSSLLLSSTSDKKMSRVLSLVTGENTRMTHDMAGGVSLNIHLY
ncbi:hypothetical protein L1987_71867 [Smallanthus sonchifolius]|uniref:Uncharacterized protein n=1 Tax=Smallanthus sonchifolius TaxID=185202 RepID=A0ACB9ATZ2_9ASTR|nr:hypothetical protein L1987_71867 [Smallanthus sonchifolius]